jgi:hypothetical protein
MKANIIMILGLITFLGILWFYQSTKCLEGLESEEEKPEIDAEKAKALAASFKKQMAEAGIPEPNPGEVNSLFSQLIELARQQIAASKKAEAELDAALASTPVTNTRIPTFVAPALKSQTFFNGTRFSDAFCELNRETSPANLNSQCAVLTAENCNATSCCVWANGAKCVAGDSNGPTFINGVSSDADYYSYKYKCYGGCPP